MSYNWKLLRALGGGFCNCPLCSEEDENEDERELFEADKKYDEWNDRRKD